MSTQLMIRMKTRQQLIDEGYFEDGFKDFWESKECYDLWDKSLEPGGLDIVCVFADDFGEIIDYHDEYRVRIKDMKWGIAEYFPKRDFPEYYL